MGKLPPLHHPPPVVRYEREHPGELIHIDTKKLGRFQRLGHRVTGNRHQCSEGVGWDFLHVCVDSASRLAYVEIHANALRYARRRFLIHALRFYFRDRGGGVQRVMTDNGSAGPRSTPFTNYSPVALAWCTSAHAPWPARTNGKAETLHPDPPASVGLSERIPELRCLRNAALPAWDASLQPPAAPC